MSTVNAISGYYNLFDSTKGYTELLFRAGKVLQSKEVNEIQSMLKSQIKNIGNTLLTNGDIIEGCQLVVKSKTQVTITRGKIYLDGDVRDISDTDVEITGVGTEIIGAILTSEVVTPDEDTTLLDVSTGYDNYNQDGAYRLKESVKIVVNNSDASILYTLQDGSQLTVNSSEDLSQLDKINSTLARRTFDESGNYKVSGLKLVDKNQNNTDKIFISMESGKAYVKGYEVNKTSATPVALDRPTDLRAVENEPKIYKSSSSTYHLNNSYVSNITKVASTVRVTQTITRGNIVGGIDYLSLSPVVLVESVKQGSKTYVQVFNDESSGDYKLTNDGIDWSAMGDAPDPGSSYEVTWIYNKLMEKDVDYVLVQDGTSGVLKFLENGDKPTEDSTVLVNYEFALCRRDVISLNKDGSVVVTKGQPDILRTVESPNVDVTESLVLGSVLLKPNSDDVIIINNNTQTIPMLDLYKMLERITALEYNQAMSDLDNEAAEGESATELMGVFTDGFLGLSKSDTYHPEWTASLDIENQELTLPFTTNIQNMVPDEDTDYHMHKFNRLLTTQFSETVLESQMLATGVIRVNSYNAFPRNPVVSLNPQVDNWINHTTMIIDGGVKVKSVVLRRWWYHKSASWAQQEKELWKSYGIADGGESLGWNSTQVSTTKAVTTSILDEAIMYMRQNTVKIYIQNLEPLTDNVTATFDGIPIKLTASKAEYTGTTPGTLKADTTGKSQGTFTIPENTLCGTRELRVYPANNPSLIGVSKYTSNGRLITQNITVFQEITKLVPTDPLAQSFQFDTDHYITGIGIYFNSKDSSPVTVQVRNMINGYPGTKCYAEKVLYPEDILTSSDSNTETKVVFDDPVFCNANEQYCFTILSDSDLTSVYIAETTKVDLNSKTQISKNPYLNGTLFSSSNALTWTAHQSSDLKFKMYGAKFESTGHCLFKTVGGISIDRLMIATESFIPSGCTINWKYSINGEDYRPIETYDDRELSEIGTSVTIRADLTAKPESSPAIAIDGLILCLFSNEKQGVYISKNVNVPDGFNQVKQIVDLHLPANTNVNMYYATDTSGTTWIPLNNTKTEVKSTDYSTYTFEGTLGSVANNYRCKIELTTVNKTFRPIAKNLRSIMKTV